MRFNVKNADWLSERIRDRIMQMVSYYFLPRIMQVAKVDCFDSLSYCSSSPFFGISLDNCSILRIKISSCL